MLQLGSPPLSTLLGWLAATAAVTTVNDAAAAAAAAGDASAEELLVAIASAQHEFDVRKSVHDEATALAAVPVLVMFLVIVPYKALARVCLPCPALVFRPSSTFH